MGYGSLKPRTAESGQLSFAADWEVLAEVLSVGLGAEVKRLLAYRVLGATQGPLPCVLSPMSANGQRVGFGANVKFTELASSTLFVPQALCCHCVVSGPLLPTASCVFGRIVDQSVSGLLGREAGTLQV